MIRSLASLCLNIVKTKLERGSPIRMSETTFQTIEIFARIDQMVMVMIRTIEKQHKNQIINDLAYESIEYSELIRWIDDD